MGGLGGIASASESETMRMLIYGKPVDHDPVIIDELTSPYRPAELRLLAALLHSAMLEYNHINRIYRESVREWLHSDACAAVAFSPRYCLSALGYDSDVVLPMIITRAKAKPALSRV